MFLLFTNPTLVNDLIDTVVTVALGGLMVGWLSQNWTRRRKEQEAKLLLAQDFANAYGEFFIVWKLWNARKKQGGGVFPEASRWKLMERAGAAEAKVEALLVALAFTRTFDRDQQEVLGRFRQAFQTLRECIAEDRVVPWSKDEDPQYKTFKKLMVEVGFLVIGKTSYLNAYEAWLEITSNKYEAMRGSTPWDAGLLPRERAATGTSNRKSFGRR